MHSGNKKCLSEFKFGAYLEGKLLPDEEESLDRHFIECEDCRDQFIAINRVAMQKDNPDDEDVPEYLIKRAIRMYPEKRGLFDIVLSIARDSFKVDHCANDLNIFSPLPAAGLRSNKKVCPEMVILKKSFDDIDVELDIEKISENICNIRVTVNDLKAEFLRDSIRVELISGGRELVSNLLENGETILEDVTVGKYTVKICQKRKTLGEIVLKIQ